MKSGIKKTAVSTVLWATLLVTMGVSLSACSSEKEEAGAETGEVLATDRVDEASELARQNAPEAEKLDFPETTPMPAADTAEGEEGAEGGAAGTEVATAEDGAATDTAGNTATASADTEAASTANTETTDTDAAATTTEPATN